MNDMKQKDLGVNFHIKTPLNAAFWMAFNDEVEGRNLRVECDGQTKELKFFASDTRILKFRDGELVEVNFPHVIRIRDNFLADANYVEKLSLPEVMIIGDNFMYDNHYLREVYFPNVLEVGDAFLARNEIISHVEMPKLKKAGKAFLFSNNKLRGASFDKLKVIGDNFLYSNQVFGALSLPCITELGDNCFYSSMDNLLTEMKDAINQKDPALIRKISKNFGNANSGVLGVIKGTATVCKEQLLSLGKGKKKDR